MKVWQGRKFFQKVGWKWVGVKGLEGQDQGSNFIHVVVGEPGSGLGEEKMTRAGMGIRGKEAQ